MAVERLETNIQREMKRREDEREGWFERIVAKVEIVLFKLR